jgi:hypothetical protein
MNMRKKIVTAPIILFIYNRLWHTERTVEALLKNDMADKSELIIFSDSAKTKEDIEKVNSLRHFIRNIDGFQNVRIIEREKNYGLAENIINGVTDIINEYGRAIILEDDLVTSPFFLTYMNTALNLYENEERVTSIHGYIYPVKKKLPDTFFIKGADCWGWATWKRGWGLFNRNGSELLEKLVSQRKQREFDFDNSYPYMQMLKDQIAGKNNSWAIRWYASVFLADKLTLYPGVTLVNNIGFDGSGTHCGKGNDFNSEHIEEKVSVRRIPTQENMECRKIIARYFKAIKNTLFKRITRKIGSFDFLRGSP